MAAWGTTKLRGLRFLGTRRLRKLAIAVLVVAATLLLVETGLRVAGRHYRAAFWDAFAEQQPPGDWVTVLALGESTTAGLWLTDQESYPRQLERLLRAHYGTERIRVLIPPHIGQNTSQMLHRFPQYLTASRPALVLMMAGVNNGWSLAESNLGAFMPAHDWRTHAFRLRRLADDVKIFRLARVALAGLGSSSGVRDDLAGRPRFTQWPPPNDPLVQGIGEEPFMRMWRSDVGQMIEIAQASGVGVILMTYPNYDTPPLAEFEALAQAHSVPLVMNHIAFAALIEEGRGEEFFFEDMRHPNARGYAIVADNAFQAVVAGGFLEPRLAELDARVAGGDR